jgi:VanZ family protein
LLSIIPTSSHIGESDKLNHFLAFFLFAILLRFSYGVTFFQGIVLSIAFGGFIELIQAFIPYRSCEFLDLGADGLGAILGSILLSILLEVKNNLE